MAGIGFRLRPLLSEDTVASTMKAYLIGAVVSSGPWLITFIVLAALNFLQLGHIGFNNMILFQGILLYIFAFTLIIVGIFQMPVTRYVADLIYKQDLERIVPVFVGAVLTIGSVLLLVSGVAVFRFTGWDFPLQVVSVGTFVMVGLIWVAMIFMSATKDFMAILRAFIVGGIVGIVGGWGLGNLYFVPGYLMGFLLGQSVIFTMLCFRIFEEFPVDGDFDFSFLSYIVKLPYLMLAGWLYQLSIWVDKFVFWFSKEGKVVSHFIYASPIYDYPFFLAYVTIIPALAIFLVRTETHFYDHYRAFYACLSQKRSYRSLEAEKTALIASVTRSIFHLIRRQGFITILVILLAPHLVGILKLDWVQLGVLRIVTLALFLQVLFQVQLTLLMYFEWHRFAAFLTALFVVVNGVGTWLSLKAGLAYYGYGYFVAAFLVLMIGFPVLFSRLHRLDEITLMGTDG